LPLIMYIVQSFIELCSHQLKIIILALKIFSQSENEESKCIMIHFDFFLLIGWNFQKQKQWVLIRDANPLQNGG
jgi:hypothetical protein